MLSSGSSTQRLPPAPLPQPRSAVLIGSSRGTALAAGEAGSAGMTIRAAMRANPRQRRALAPKVLTCLFVFVFVLLRALRRGLRAFSADISQPHSEKNLGYIRGKLFFPSVFCAFFFLRIFVLLREHVGFLADGDLFKSRPTGG